MLQIAKQIYEQLKLNCVKLGQSYIPERYQTLDNFDLVVLVVVATFLLRFLWRNFFRIFHSELYLSIKKTAILFVLKLPIVRKKIDGEISKAADEFKSDLTKHNLERVYHELNEEGVSWEEIDQRLKNIDMKDTSVKKTGKVTGGYYVDDKSNFEQDVVSRCGKYLYYNLMHYDFMYGLRQMEAELISWYSTMLNGGEESVGTFTSGGTESIFMGVLSMREWAKAKKGITEPELILPQTAHPAFNKACFYLGIKTVVLPVSEKTGYVASALQYRRKVNGNTIGFVASAGNYPHGNIEPIDEISKVALKYNIPMHVDCCLGGYSMMFAEDIGVDVPLFDFRNPAVFSISIDPHKYGLAPKGASLVIFKNRAYKEAGLFVLEGWPGGLYGTVSFGGSRPSSSMVGSWIASIKSGKEGLRKDVKDIHDCVKYLESNLVEAGFEILGEPKLNVVAFTIKSDFADDFQISGGMGTKGWKLQMCQKPFCIHIAITQANIKKVRESFMKDLKEVMQECKENPEAHAVSKSRQLYGSTAKAPDGVVVQDMIKRVFVLFNQV